MAPGARTWLERFRDPEGSSGTLPYLDGIRAFAVLMIFLRHAWGLSGSPPLVIDLPLGMKLGFSSVMTMFSSGVDLFFVLSGFLLARGFLRADFQGLPVPDTRRYLLQRILRIGPPYWIALALIVFLFTPSLIRGEAVYSWKGAESVLSHVFFAQMLNIDAFGSFNIAAPFWTISIEMTFYLLLPWMVRLFFGQRWLVSLPISIVLVLGWLFTVRYGLDDFVLRVVGEAGLGGYDEQVFRFFLSHAFPAHLFHFAVGITLCNLVVRRELGWRSSRMFQSLTGKRAGLTYFLLGLAVLVFWLKRHGSASLANNWGWPLNYMTAETYPALEYYFLEEIPFAMAYGLLILGASLGPEWIRRSLSTPVLCFFGVIGYAVYLLHMPLMYHIKSIPWMSLLVGSEYFAALLGTSSVATLILSVGFFVAVERPSMLMARRVGRRSGEPSLSPGMGRAEVRAGHPHS
ncbi:acyltransferase [Stigmatella sp. ncwal1]|uniref:Acyltransferase n=1 Tax=Stigmatella ashevillensis TaxID=2995309 RepID=A0ABT5D3R5_9BACT|nr:acyltransferase [Stigmatella ashevillena]